MISMIHNIDNVISYFLRFHCSYGCLKGYEKKQQPKSTAPRDKIHCKLLILLVVKLKLFFIYIFLERFRNRNFQLFGYTLH